jgi:hypothetical protein
MRSIGSVLTLLIHWLLQWTPFLRWGSKYVSNIYKTVYLYVFTCTSTSVKPTHHILFPQKVDLDSYWAILERQNELMHLTNILQDMFKKMEKRVCKQCIMMISTK